MLSLDAVTVTANDKTLLSVDEVTLAEGTFYGLLGPNGAGKSTLLNVISEELPYSGSLTLYNQPLAAYSPNFRARHRGVMPQQSQLAFPFTAEEVVELGLTPLTLAKRDHHTAVNDHMRSTDCFHLRGRAYPSLSGGERQRVQLARVLLQISQAEKPPLLLLDEPTSAQDLGQQHFLLQMIKRLCREKHYCAIAVLHDLNQAMRYCDTCLLLNQGSIAEQGPPQAILTAENVARHWQYRPTVIPINDGRAAII